MILVAPQVASAQSKAEVNVEPREIEGLDKAVTSAAIAKRQKSIERCYGKALKKNAGARGATELRLYVGAKGRVIAASVIHQPQPDQWLARCARQHAMDLRFPAKAIVKHARMRLHYDFGGTGSYGTLPGGLIGALAGGGIIGGGGSLGPGGLGQVTGVGVHGHSVPSIRSGTMAVQGSLSREVIRRLVRRNINQIRFCYETGLSSTPTLQGRVTIHFVISPTGAVESSTVTSTTLGNASVEQCAARVIERIAFPAPAGGGVVTVTYPFNMTPH